MEKTDIAALLFELCSLNGTSGNENGIIEKSAELLGKYMPVQIDTLGNCVGRSEGDGPIIMLDAHADQIGLVVTAIDEKGFLRVSKCGGVDLRTITAQQVTVHGKTNVKGVVSSVPPHLSKGDEGSKAGTIEDVYIDVGFSKEEAEKIITPGDRITIDSTPVKLLGNRVSCGCIDDRSGIVAILRCFDILQASGKRICPLVVNFAVQEETGGSGAQTAAFNSGADEALIVDVGFARAPGVRNEEAGIEGKGAMIGFAPSLDYSISKKLVDVAAEKEIPYQYDVMGGRTGTDGDNVQTQCGGIRTGLISIPIRNMHTPVETVCVDDIESVARLMAEYIIERSAF